MFSLTVGLSENNSIKGHQEGEDNPQIGGNIGKSHN